LFLAIAELPCPSFAAGTCDFDVPYENHRVGYSIDYRKGLVPGAVGYCSAGLRMATVP